MHHYSRTPATNQAIVVGQQQIKENLPFTIRVVNTEQALDKAVSIRHQAYGRHVPELARTLSVPEAHDAQAGTTVLLAESKLDGSPVGTMRIQTNQYGPLGVEGTIQLPEWLQGQSLAEATRLGISLGRTGHVAKLALFKAFYLYCLEAGIDWMVITARAPLDRQYENLLFQEVLPGAGYVPMKHIGNIPHRVLALPVARAQQLWEDAGHSLLQFMVHTQHPDIRIDAAQAQEPVHTASLHAPLRELGARVS